MYSIYFTGGAILGQAAECQGEWRPSGLNAKANECQAAECQGEWRPSRNECQGEWRPSGLNAKANGCQAAECQM